MNLIKRKTLLMGLFRCTHKYGSDEGAFLMLKQSVQAAGFDFLEPQPQTPSPEISWEVPPPDFDIPDDPVDNYDQLLLAEALRDALALRGLLSKNQFCATSLAVCVKVKGQTVTKAPDWFYVPDVYPTEKNRRSYTPIAEGALPSIVMEFLSDHKGKEYEKSDIYPYGKWYFYEQILKVPWYVIFDSNVGQLEVYHLEAGRYKKQSQHANGHYWIDSINLFLGVWEGLKEDFKRNTFWLRWWDADEQVLSWQYEKAKQSEIEKQQALEKAESEKLKAQQAEIEKQQALEKAEKLAFEKTRQIAKQMLQAHVEMAFIQQITGLDENSILLLKTEIKL